MPIVRTLVSTLMAGFLAFAGLVLAASGVPAHAQVTGQSARTTAAVSNSPAISIDAVTPRYAQPGSTITVSGTLSNNTGSAIQGIEVQLQSSPQPFGSRSEMDAFTADGSGFSPVNEGTPVAVTATLPNGGTARWTASFTAASAQYDQFGVYPLVAQAISLTSYLPLATDCTLLPFWPGKGSAQPLNIAWIWPLIDVPQQELPQQGNCSQTLASDSLETSLGTSGRLGRLLSSGLHWAGRTDLTWAVDPALLSDASVMTQPYKVGGSSACTGAKPMPASAAASGWLATLRKETASQPMFLTPYADADVAALSHAGLDTDIRTAYTVGESVASQLLSRPSGVKAAGTGDGGSASVAWLAGGTADASVLTSLASSAGISTVVLSSNEMPVAASSSYQADTAVTSATTGIGTTMNVLLADSQLTSLLGSTTANASAGAQFATEQEFLAQTAMIAAELPNSSRSIVVAPPRRWDPSTAEANALLSLTSKAPWLQPTPLSGLSSSRGDQVSRQALPANSVSSDELSSSYLNQVQSVGATMALYKELLYQPSGNLLRSLDEVIAVTESAAWRGSGIAGGKLALARLSSYLQDSEHDVQIITGNTKRLLGGTSGDTPVSVQNTLDVPVQVRVAITGLTNSQLTVGKFDSLITVPAQKTGTVYMPLHSSRLGTSMMQLQLLTKDGSPLTWTSQPLSIQVTRYGQALLVLIVSALGVLVLTSAMRWTRQRLTGSGAHARSGGTG
jgi:hypothetical protein